eukprot:403372038
MNSGREEPDSKKAASSASAERDQNQSRHQNEGGGNQYQQRQQQQNGNQQAEGGVNNTRLILMIFVGCFVMDFVTRSFFAADEPDEAKKVQNQHGHSHGEGHEHGNLHETEYMKEASRKYNREDYSDEQADMQSGGVRIQDSSIGKEIPVEEEYENGLQRKGNFLQVKKYIEQSAPEVIVTGGEFPPGPTKTLLAQVFSFVQMGFILFIFMGDALFRALNKPVPELYTRISQNKWGWVIGTWFIGGQLQGALLQTGAFEILVNDNLEFSKIASGRMPDLNIINNIFEKYNVILG